MSLMLINTQPVRPSISHLHTTYTYSSALDHLGIWQIIFFLYSKFLSEWNTWNIWISFLLNSNRSQVHLERFLFAHWQYVNHTFIFMKVKIFPVMVFKHQIMNGTATLSLVNWFSLITSSENFDLIIIFLNPRVNGHSLPTLRLLGMEKTALEI